MMNYSILLPRENLIYRPNQVVLSIQAIHRISGVLDTAFKAYNNILETEDSEVRPNYRCKEWNIEEKCKSKMPKKL